MADRYPERDIDPERYSHHDDERRPREHGRDERGILERAGDEMRSWFGDEGAARRRRMDSRREAVRYERPYDETRRPERESQGYEPPYGRERGYAGREEYYGAGDFPSYRTEREYGGDREGGYYERPWPFRQSPERGYGDMWGPGRYPDDYGREASRLWRAESKQRESWMVPGPHRGRGPRGYQRSDERIREDINERLTYHGEIDATDIEVLVKSGEVTLRGTVRSRDEKRKAEDVADTVLGVRDINNHIKVGRANLTEPVRQPDEPPTGQLP
jgi:osmotically-inducible protein OsmY